MGSAKSHQLIRKAKSMVILTVGIDLAKNVFRVHGVNRAGKPELVKSAVARDKLLELIATPREQACRSSSKCRVPDEWLLGSRRAIAVGASGRRAWAAVP
jgi:hypothetical protein